MVKTKFLLFLMFAVSGAMSAQDKLVDIMKGEINRNFEAFKAQPVPAYYISYRVRDTHVTNLSYSFGGLVDERTSHNRHLNTDVRVGSYEMDNTRELRERGGSGKFDNSMQLPLTDIPLSVQNAIWRATDSHYKDALTRFENVKANVAVKVAAEDLSDDFSHEKREKYIEPAMQFSELKFNSAEWKKRLKKYGAILAANQDILNSNISLEVELVRRYFVDTEGAEIAENDHHYRLQVSASTMADDGMQLPLYKTYWSRTLKGVPSDAQVAKDIAELSALLTALKNAPIAESYSGPALMTAGATGVFFHEIFGHRVEGARLKQEADAQTFKTKVGQKILPEDMSLYYAPQLKAYKGIEMNGGYVFDDEGVRGQRVDIVKDGVLNAFLMSRTPITGFSNSNGHGRANIDYDCFSRQSNLVIESSAPKTDAQLRDMLREQLKAENRDYGYIFGLVEGGFTQTGRYQPNAFNVMPLVVYRIYADGRPDELVRGVDLVGTPLSIFSQIAACGTEYDAFNGQCGAESGWIPQSCVAPTLYIKMIETQRKAKSQTQPPMLKRPHEH